MMELVDAFRGHAEEYFLADKETKMTLEALKHYIALAEHQTGRRLKCLHMDGGSEFCNRLWEGWCGEWGIVLKSSAAYSSESNGIVERSHCTVIECT